MSNVSSLGVNTGESLPLSQLARSLLDESPSPSPVARPSVRVETFRDVQVTPRATHLHHEEKHCHGYSWWHAVLLFLLLAIIFYFLFFALRPWFVLNQCDDSHSWSEEHGHHEGEINNGKLLGSAVLAALIVLFVLWIFWALASSFA
jgi:hypothetical protein